MEKVKITRDEFEIKKTLEAHYSQSFVEDAKKMMVKHFCESKTSWNPYINLLTKRLTLEEFVLIFVIGDYEVEKTGEEKLLEFYKSLGFSSDDIREKNIIEKAVCILGLEIEGINV